MIWLATAVILLTLATQGRFIAWLYHEIVRLFVLLELAGLRFVQWVFPPKYELLGGCHKSGQCCKQIVADPPPWIRDTFLLNWFVGYHRIMHNFHVWARGPEQELIMRCDHLTEAERCGIYRYRPLFCRNYPARTWYEPPRILPGCGFRTASREVAKMKARPSLHVINSSVSVHHPTPQEPGLDQTEHFHYVDESS